MTTGPSAGQAGDPADIRPLSADRLPDLLGLYRHLHAEDALPSAGQISRVWSEILANPRLRIFGRFVGGELVASCALCVIPNLTRACRPYAVIENVVTHPEHRRHGHGTALLRAALAHAWSEGCYKAMLLTGRKDESTLRFYQSAGFDPNDKQAFIARPTD